jgi:hypothetical protein
LNTKSKDQRRIILWRLGIGGKDEYGDIINSNCGYEIKFGTGRIASYRISEAFYKNVRLRIGTGVKPISLNSLCIRYVISEHKRQPQWDTPQTIQIPLLPHHKRFSLRSLKSRIYTSPLPNQNTGIHVPRWRNNGHCPTFK